MPRGVYERSKVNGRNVQPVYDQPAHESERVYWDAEEIRKLAEEWVLQRVAHPMETGNQLLNRAQDKVFANDAKRKRDLPAVSSHKTLHAAILNHWSNFVAKPPEPAAPSEPIVQLVTVEVPRNLTFDEMLRLCDEPSLTALLTAKRIERENRHDQLLRDIALKAGAVPPVVETFVPNGNVFNATQRTRRIVLVGPKWRQYVEIKKMVEDERYPVELRVVDAEVDRISVPICDFVIATRYVSHEVRDKVNAAAGHATVMMCETGNNEGIVQKIRDICSRQDKTFVSRVTPPPPESSGPKPVRNGFHL